MVPPAKPRRRLGQVWSRLWAPLLGAFLCAYLGRPALAEVCGDHQEHWCCDGNTPTLGGCGEVGQRICLVSSSLNFSDCPSVCAPGLRYDATTATCQPPCSYCDDAGFCCGDVDQTACLLGATGASDCAGNGGCKPGTQFYAKYGVCGPNPIPEQTPLNGSDQRPFYIWAHNPNTPGKILADLAAGANALEPDITVADDQPCPSADPTIADLVDSDSSSPYRPGLCSDTHLADWLDLVHAIARTNSQIALIAFDIKSSAADATHVRHILDAVRSHLTYDVTNLTIILSVGSLKDATNAFDGVTVTGAELGPREGVQIDGENNAADVHNFFVSRGYFQIGYGDGTAVNAGDLSFFGVQPRALDYGAFLRASIGSPQAVSYAYLLNSRPQMNAFMDAGVDGIIPGDITSVAMTSDPVCQNYYESSINPKYYAYCSDSPNPDPNLDVTEIQILASLMSQHPELRLATRDDNPLQPKLQSYGLEVYTPPNSSVSDTFGTDANLRFVLNGCKGSAQITINSGFIIPVTYNSGRMEAGQYDHVTIPSADLGRLTSITIYNDGTGDSPDWTFQNLRVSSAGYIGADYGHQLEYVALGTFSLPHWHSVTLNLVPTFDADSLVVPTLPAIVAQCSAPLPAAPVASDACSGHIVGTTTNTGPFGQGDWQIAWVFNDGNGHSKVAYQQVHVHDTIPPLIVGCPTNITVFTGPGQTSCGQVATWAPPTASDNCTLASFTSDHQPGDTFPVGTTLVTYTAKDAVGNQTQCQFTVTVVDNTPPTITCPGNIILDATNALGSVVYFSASAADNCDPAPAITYSQNPGTVFAIGTNLVTSTATDAAGNHSSCQFTVTVRGPRAIELDVLSQLLALQSSVTRPPGSAHLANALRGFTAADSSPYWLDDAHVAPQGGNSIFTQKMTGVQSLERLAASNPALAPTLKTLMAREVLSCRILVEAVLARASANNLAGAQAFLAKGDAALAAGNPSLAITHYGTAWTQAMGN